MKAGIWGVLLINIAALGAEVNPPMPVVVPMRAGGELRGKLTAFDEAGFTYQPNTAAAPATVKWMDVQARTVLALNERLLGEKASATQWFELGKLVHVMPGGGPSLSARPFARALKLDPTLKGEIDSFKTNPTTKRADADDELLATTQASGQAAGDRPTRGSWPKLAPEDNEAAVGQLKRRAADLFTHTKAKLTPYETKFFLFYSDLSQTEAQRWAGVLDRMYARLAELFNVPKDENIWRGKAVIIVFAGKEDFLKFEADALHNPQTGKAGFCHQFGNGDVIVTFYRSAADQDFARILVHETTHGFLHRHRSPYHIPSWANEGLADVMKFELVPAAGIKQNNDAIAKQTLTQRDALKNFFTAQNIDNAQYSIARTLAEFMIKQNKQGYVEFINAMKDRVPWEEALKDKFGMTRDQLIQAYGASMGIRDLKP